MKFVTDQQLETIYDELMNEFTVGNFHSESSTREIGKHVFQLLKDYGLPQRKSLALMIAKKSLLAWRTACKNF